VRISAPDLARLDGALAGSVLVPGSPGYESARTPALARFHHTEGIVLLTYRLALRAGRHREACAS
jgi:hypothetical protein